MTLVASLVLAFLTLTASAIAQVAPEKLIVPGRSIGPWTLDMMVNDLVKAIGPMQAIGPPPDLVQFSTGENPGGLNDRQDLWAHRFDQVLFRITTKQKDDQRLTTMNVYREEGGYKTKEGVGVRSKQEDVEAAFGRPDQVTKANANQEHWIYDKLGIGFRIRPISGLVENIIVFRPGEAKERWKL
jgi:hypothetical protein